MQYIEPEYAPHLCNEKIIKIYDRNRDQIQYNGAYIAKVREGHEEDSISQIVEKVRKKHEYR